MKKTGPYTIDELVEATGFDKRTIAYYVQEGLLPKIGRRGRLTRYPRIFADRLQVIKRLREAEESGERPFPMTLAEIREAFERIPSKELSAMAAGALAVALIDHYTKSREDDLDGILPPPHEDRFLHSMKAPPDMATRDSRMRLMLEQTDEPDLFMPRRMSRPPTVEEPMADYNEGPTASKRRDRPSLSREAPAEVHDCAGPPDPRDDSDHLIDLLQKLARTTALASRSPGRSEHWTNAPITPGLNLSGRELGEDDRLLLERAARLLRKLATGA